jgi:hypothetical protein
MKLTDNQRKHLLALANGQRSAYPGLHMGVLKSLESKGLVLGTYGLGSMSMPHTAIKWRLTAAGRAELNAVESVI